MMAILGLGAGCVLTVVGGLAYFAGYLSGLRDAKRASDRYLAQLRECHAQLNDTTERIHRSH